jgi:hypothetical protein
MTDTMRAINQDRYGTLFKPGDEVFGVLPYPAGSAPTPST